MQNEIIFYTVVSIDRLEYIFKMHDEASQEMKSHTDVVFALIFKFLLVQSNITENKFYYSSQCYTFFFAILGTESNVRLKITIICVHGIYIFRIYFRYVTSSMLLELLKHLKLIISLLSFPKVQHRVSFEFTIASYKLFTMTPSRIYLVAGAVWTSPLEMGGHHEQ